MFFVRPNEFHKPTQLHIPVHTCTCYFSSRTAACQWMRNWRFTPTFTVGVSRAVCYVVCLDAAAMLWDRCGHDSRVVFWGHHQLSVIWTSVDVPCMFAQCRISGQRWYVVQLLRRTISLTLAESFIRVAVETFVLLSVMIHCVCSNTQTPLNKYTHRASSLFNLQLCHFEPVQIDEGRKVFLNVWAFIKNLEVLLKRSSHRVDYYAPWIKQNCELVNLDWLGSKQTSKTSHLFFRSIFTVRQHTNSTTEMFKVTL